MASQDNIVKLADFPRQKDSAVAAAERVREAQTDKACELAQLALLSARPTTIAGAVAKLEAAWRIMEAARDGDELTDAGWGELTALFLGATGTLQQLKSRVA